MYVETTLVKERLIKNKIALKIGPFHQKADPLPDEMLLEFPCHVYSNIDVTTTNTTSQGIIDNEVSLFQAGPSISDSCTAAQQLLAKESSDKQEIQSRKRKRSSSSGNIVHFNILCWTLQG